MKGALKPRYIDAKPFIPTFAYFQKEHDRIKEISKGREARALRKAKSKNF